MSELSTDAAVSEASTTRTTWRAGVLGGVVGALAMGALVLAMNPPTVAVAIPALYGLAPPPNPATGLVVHAAHGAVFGVGFAAVADRLVTSLRDDARAALGAGAAYGVLTWVGGAALLMPLWLSAVGFPAAPPFPNFAPPSLLWHVVYGGVLGGVYAAAS